MDIIVLQFSMLITIDVLLEAVIENAEVIEISGGIL